MIQKVPYFVLLFSDILGVFLLTFTPKLVCLPHVKPRTKAAHVKMMRLLQRICVYSYIDVCSLSTLLARVYCSLGAAIYNVGMEY